MIELKPCPFCGGQADYHACAMIENEALAARFDGKFGVHCECCGCATKPFDGMNAAAEAWNKRHDKTGRWQIKSDWVDIHTRCSSCNADFPYLVTYKFCPECGADMRGENND